MPRRRRKRSRQGRSLRRRYGRSAAPTIQQIEGHIAAVLKAAEKLQSEIAEIEEFADGTTLAEIQGLVTPVRAIVVQLETLQDKNQTRSQNLEQIASQVEDIKNSLDSVADELDRFEIPEEEE